MKQLWTTLLIGALGLLATFFLTRTNVVREYEGKFAEWKQNYIKNYRTQPETLRVETIKTVTKWVQAKPVKIDSQLVAQMIFGLTIAEKDSLLAFLAQERQSDPIVDTTDTENQYGENIRVISTHFLSFSPFSSQPFGKFSFINEVVYPRTGTTIDTVWQEKENTRFFNSLTVALHGGYAFEPKKPLGMLELYAKLRLQSNLYIVPRYELRYLNKDLVRSASIGVGYTVE